MEIGLEGKLCLLHLNSVSHPTNLQPSFMTSILYQDPWLSVGGSDPESQQILKFGLPMSGPKSQQMGSVPKCVSQNPENGDPMVEVFAQVPKSGQGPKR
jgi:hypothetical protein